MNKKMITTDISFFINIIPPYRSKRILGYLNLCQKEKSAGEGI